MIEFSVCQEKNKLFSTFFNNHSRKPLTLRIFFLIFAKVSLQKTHSIYLISN